MQEHTGQGPEATAIAEQARRAASEGGAGGEALSALKEAISATGPDERSAAAKELAEEQPAYQALHRALTDLGIEPAAPPNQTGA